MERSVSNYKSSSSCKLHKQLLYSLYLYKIREIIESSRFSFFKFWLLENQLVIEKKISFLIKMKILLTVCLCAILTYAVCPNNCDGHGKCEANGVCSCYKKSDGSEYDYVGNDCSKRIYIVY